MDIICANCGRHLNSIEAAREHSRSCKKIPDGESIHWEPAPKSKMTQEEWEALINLINNPVVSNDDKQISNKENDNKLNLTNIICPNCGDRLFHDFKLLVWKCKECKRIYTYSELPKKRGKKTKRVINKAAEQEEAVENKQADKITADGTGKTSHNNRNKKTFNYKISQWLVAVLFIFAFSVCGLGISIFSGTFIPFWIFFGFSLIFSFEKWFSYITRKYKKIGNLYRLVLNLIILSIFGLLIWSGVKLFSQEFIKSSLNGSLIFLAELIFFIWMWRVISKNSWRWPSMKLTIFSIIILFSILAFAGVTPFDEYKNRFLDLFASDNSANDSLANAIATTVPNPVATDANTTSKIATSTPTTTPTSTPKNPSIDKLTGIYKNYYLGLVKEPKGVLNGNDCYGEFIILINNMDAKNPTYTELLNFLKSNETDEFPYEYTISVGGFYFGEAEDKIDLQRVKNIIDGTVQPNPPEVCADFAERLHNDAEKEGIRCGYVSLDIVGYTDPNNLGIASDAGHACNVFETTDKGFIYIDDTGIFLYGPSNCDKIVDVQVGKQYVPKSLFPEPGWYSTWDSIGTVINVFTTWDGDWR